MDPWYNLFIIVNTVFISVHLSYFYYKKKSGPGSGLPFISVRSFTCLD